MLFIGWVSCTQLHVRVVFVTSTLAGAPEGGHLPRRVTGFSNHRWEDAKWVPALVVVLMNVASGRRGRGDGRVDT